MRGADRARYIERVAIVSLHSNQQEAPDSTEVEPRALTTRACTLEPQADNWKEISGTQACQLAARKRTASGKRRTESPATGTPIRAGQPDFCYNGYSRRDHQRAQDDNDACYYDDYNDGY
jgi:hypothetical protein